MHTARIPILFLALVACVGIAFGATNVRSSSAVEHDVVSNGGRYVLHVREPEGGFVRGKPFVLDVRIARATSEDEEEIKIATGVELLFDADMPEHLHGMNRTPKVARLADGTFRVEGVYLHMTGWWELYLDVVEGPWTERSQMRVVLE